MILADSSVWIDHFRTPDPTLLDLLRRKRLRQHEMVVGEILLGNLRNRLAKRLRAVASRLNVSRDPHGGED